MFYVVFTKHYLQIVLAPRMNSPIKGNNSSLYFSNMVLTENTAIDFYLQTKESYLIIQMLRLENFREFRQQKSQ